MKNTFKKVFSLVLVCAIMMSIAAINPVQAAEEPVLEVVANNVEFNEKLHMMYAVYSESITDYSTVSVSLYTDAAYSEKLCDASYKGTSTVLGKTCGIFTADSGIAVQDISTKIYAKFEADGVVVAEHRRSILEYLYKRLVVDDATSVQDAMYQSLLAYTTALQTALAAQAEPVESDDINQYSYVHVTNGTVDGTYAADMLAIGTTLESVTTTLTAADGWKVEWTVTEYTDNGVEGTTRQHLSTETINEIEVVDGVNLILEANLVEDTGVAATDVFDITFNLGADGSASHKDGSTAKTDYSEDATSDNSGATYTLSITGGDKMYPASIDGKGNGCIKFGTSSAVGKCSFTVPENVNQVIIYVAKYKTNTTKINVNGVDYTLTKNSNDGAYDEIVVDTSTNKTVSFTTVSGGVRAMINTIVFKATEEVAGS